jgi:hypothetical protein
MVMPLITKDISLVTSLVTLFVIYLILIRILVGLSLGTLTWFLIAMEKIGGQPALIILSSTCTIILLEIAS